MTIFRLGVILAVCAALLGVCAPTAPAEGGVGSVYGCAWGLPGGVHADSRVTFTRGDATHEVPVKEDGCYQTMLDGGTWRVGVALPPGTPLRLLNAAFDGFAREDPVIDIRPGEMVSGPFLLLTAQAELSGRITDDAGAPVAPEVRIFSPGGSYMPLTPDETGRWRALVDPGTYHIQYDAKDNRWLSRWFRGPQSPAGAYSAPAGETVTAAAIEAVGGIDEVLERTVTIGGRLRSSLGVPLAGEEVNVLSGRDGPRVGKAVTDADGRYAVERLPAGRYWVHFATKRTLASFHGGAEWASDAQPIDVPAGAMLTDVDGVSPVGGAVSGRVVDTQGNPVPGIQLTTYHGSLAAISPVVEAITRADGTFDTGHVLRRGTFYLRAMGAVDSFWQPVLYSPGGTPALLTSNPPAMQTGLEIVMRRIGEPMDIRTSPFALLAPPGWRGPTDSNAPTRTPIVTLPIRCPTGCTVLVTKKGARAVLARGSAKVGATRVRLPLTKAGRKATRHRSVKAVARIRPRKGPSRSVTVRLRRSR